MAIILTPQSDDLAYDLLKWLVASAVLDGPAAAFVNGEIAEITQEDGTFTLYCQYADDAPNDMGLLNVVSDEEMFEFAPVRRATVNMLVRATDNATASGRTRAQAAVEAISEFLRDVYSRNKAMFELPSGRTVLVIQRIKTSPAGLDSSGRFQMLLEFQLQYRNERTQSS